MDTKQHTFAYTSHRVLVKPALAHVRRHKDRCYISFFLPCVMQGAVSRQQLLRQRVLRHVLAGVLTNLQLSNLHLRKCAHQLTRMNRIQYRKWYKKKNIYVCMRYRSAKLVHVSHIRVPHSHILLFWLSVRISANQSRNHLFGSRL